MSDTPSEPILQHSQAQSPTKKSLEPAVSDPGRESSGEGKDHVPALPSDLPAPLPIRKSGAPRTSANSYRSGAIRSSAASQGSQTAASSCDEHSGQAAARPPSRFQTQMDLCRAVFKTQWVKIALSPSGKDGGGHGEQLVRRGHLGVQVQVTRRPGRSRVTTRTAWTWCADHVTRRHAPTSLMPSG